jgi:lysine 2,3-aminomutase
VKPYYLFQGDMTRGTNHFRTPIATGLKIMEALECHTSGLAVPVLAVDLPHGGGKVRLHHGNVPDAGTNKEFINYKGLSCTYIDTV